MSLETRRPAERFQAAHEHTLRTISRISSKGSRDKATAGSPPSMSPSIENMLSGPSKPISLFHEKTGICIKKAQLTLRQSVCDERFSFDAGNPPQFHSPPASPCEGEVGGGLCAFARFATRLLWRMAAADEPIEGG